MPGLDLPQTIPGLTPAADRDNRIRLNRAAMFDEQNRKAQSDQLSLEAQQRKATAAQNFDPNSIIPGLTLAGTTRNSSGEVTQNFKPADPLSQTVPYDSLPSEEQNIVHGLLNANLPISVLGRMKPEQKTRILSATQEVDPNWSMTEYGSRQRLRQGFTSGPQANNITSANTVVGHLNSLSQAAKELGNSSFTPWNQVANTAEGLIGNPAPVKFNIAANAVTSELSKLFRGTGAATDQDVREWRKSINPNMSPDQLQTAISEAVNLMGSRLDALKNQWETGIKSPKDFKFLDDKSRKVLGDFGFNPDAIDPVAGGTASPQAASAPQSQPQQGEPPQRPVVNSQQEWEALPVGTRYRDSQGKPGVKK